MAVCQFLLLSNNRPVTGLGFGTMCIFSAMDTGQTNFNKSMVEMDRTENTFLLVGLFKNELELGSAILKCYSQREKWYLYLHGLIALLMSSSPCVCMCVQ